MTKHIIIFISLLCLISCGEVLDTSSPQSNIVQTLTPTVVPSNIDVTVTRIPSTTPQLQIKFKGEVLREQIFEYQISDNLIFQLRPIQYGWKIWVGDENEPQNDFISVVTPPYHGMNARFVEGWHFRNSDNSGPNEPGPKLVQAPQKERRFYFVLNETDYQIAYSWLRDESLPSDEEREQLRIKREQFEPREGKLTITQLELGNLEVGEQAWIESMEFEVELSLPSDFE